ncbi:hypothetical protein [Nocardioides sp. Leaf285]|nr:hypothetical protein [Nocardioides sp. Leaf285]
MNDEKPICRCQQMQARLDERLALLARVEALESAAATPPAGEQSDG